MKHYYHPLSRAVTTDWMLQEMNIPHEQVLMDYTSGANDAPEFRAINPMGKIPVLVDGDVVVTEAAAICAYLADRFPEKGMAPPIDSPLRGTYYRYLFFSGTSLETMFAVKQMGLEGYPAQSAGWGDEARCLATVEDLTPETGWALGEFSTVDIVYGGTLDFCVQFGWMPDPSPKVRGYVERIKARPAYRTSHDESWHTL